MLIDHSLVLPGALDTTFFAVRGTMKQLVYSVLTLTGVTYQLYDVKSGPITTAVGAFTIPALISFGVSYFSKGAGSLDVVAVNGSNITVRVRTYNRKFAPVLDQQVEAHLQYTTAPAQSGVAGIIVSNIVMFQDDGKYLRVLNGTDPVNSVPRFNFYKVGHTKRALCLSRLQRWFFLCVRQDKIADRGRAVRRSGHQLQRRFWCKLDFCQTGATKLAGPMVSLAQQHHAHGRSHHLRRQLGRWLFLAQLSGDCGGRPSAAAFHGHGRHGVVCVVWHVVYAGADQWPGQHRAQDRLGQFEGAGRTSLRIRHADHQRRQIFHR
ncbi:MAG: hypothetical protein NTV22_02775 [bacterium]|nr:hypothetical protein [bacterium]